ncbi:MAG: glycosyltransferase family 39 protein [Candidatus Bathyarchaeia archaeon]|nr:glycosyltransferase family 39 protein [Candidatus Bathyarchaeota archaeon]
MKITRKVIVAISMLLISIALRLYLIDETSIMPDEPIYVEAGRRYVDGFGRMDFRYDIWSYNAEHPPIAKLLIGLTQLSFCHILGGDTHALYLSSRISSVIAGSLIPLSIYLLGSPIYGELTCLIAGLAIALSPWMIYHSTLATLDIFASLFTTISFLTLYYVKPDNKMYILLGIFSGLAIGSKGTAIICIIGILLYLILNYIFGGERRNLGKLLVRLLASIFIAILTFIVTWPWLWPNPLERGLWVLEFHASHMARGHTTFYAGNVYTHVPPWVPIYIIYVKNPLVTTISVILFVGYIAKALIKRKHNRGDLLIASWLLGGIATYSSFSIILGDHYILPLAPAIYISNIYAATTITKCKKTIYRNLGLIIIASTIASLGSGLYRYREAPGAYVNEVIARGDEAIIMIDTGYEDIADYMSKLSSINEYVVVATPYYPNILEIDFRRKGLDRVLVIDMSSIGYADYAVVPVLYARRYGIPKAILDRFHLIYTITSGNTILAYIFEANKTMDKYM